MERSRVHHYMGMLRGLGVLVWLCATYFCSGLTGTRYSTWHSQPEPHPAHLSKLASFDQPFFFFSISLCVPLPIVPFSLASLCLSGSVRQCSHLFFTFHLLSVLSIVSVVLNFVLSPFPLVFNVLAMHHAPNQPSWKPPGHYRPLLLNIQLVFNERLLLSSTLPPSPSHISYSQT